MARAPLCLFANTFTYPSGGGHFWVYLNWALGSIDQRRRRNRSRLLQSWVAVPRRLGNVVLRSRGLGEFPRRAIRKSRVHFTHIPR